MTTCGRGRRPAGSVSTVGVSTHVAPSKRSASAPSTPSCSEPAIGWPPTNRGSPTAAATGPLTLPTSVTSPGPAARAARASPAMVSTGVHTKVTSAAGSSPMASSAPSAKRPLRPGRVGVPPRDMPPPGPQRQPDASPPIEPASPTTTGPSGAPRPDSRPTSHRGGRRSGRSPPPGRRGELRPRALGGRCMSTRTHRGVPPGDASSRADRRGTSPRPISRAGVAGKVAVRSSVAVNRMLMRSSLAMSLRESISADQGLDGLGDGGLGVGVDRGRATQTLEPHQAWNECTCEPTIG